jgi:uncharacterized membrane protein
MTHDQIPRENEHQTDAEEPPVVAAAKTTGRALLWLVIAVAVVAVIIGVFLLGPFGLFILVPAVLLVWFVAGLAAGGPATGA